MKDSQDTDQRPTLSNKKDRKSVSGRLHWLHPNSNRATTLCFIDSSLTESHSTGFVFVSLMFCLSFIIACRMFSHRGAQKRLSMHWILTRETSFLPPSRSHLGRLFFHRRGQRCVVQRTTDGTCCSSVDTF